MTSAEAFPPNVAHGVLKLGVLAPYVVGSCSTDPPPIHAAE